MVVLAWRLRWRNVPTYIEKWRCEGPKYLACWRMKIINRPHLLKMKIAFLKLSNTEDLKNALKNVKKVKTMSCAGSPIQKMKTHSRYMYIVCTESNLCRLYHKHMLSYDLRSVVFFLQLQQERYNHNVNFNWVRKPSW